MAIYKDVLSIIMKKNRILRTIGLLIGSFIIAIVYNAFIVPNNLVTGGIGGLAIIVNNIFGIKITTFLNIVSFSLILISFIILGAKKTSYSLVGYVSYILMVNITEPISHYFVFELDSFLLSILIYGIFYGLGSGLIYRMGFNTGGSDSLVSIIQHYLHLPITKISSVVNGIIILLGMSIFGIEKTLYAIVFLKVYTFISEYTILGISDSKVCYIKSRKHGKIEDYIKNELNMSYSLLDSTNGIGFLKKKIIFCVVPSEFFHDFKKNVLKIDEKAVFISNDSYIVEGGTTNRFLPI